MKFQRVAKFENLLSAGFFALLLVQVWNHVMWRDELRPWQIIQQCSTPFQVVHEMRFDAVPVLWNLIIYVLTRFTDNAFLMQFVHVCIATAVVYVVARWAPFSRISKVLFAFGYFPFFEYATITRNYSLVFLLVLIACAMISSPRIRLLALAGVLFLLMQVSIWGAGLAGLLFLAAVAVAWMGPAQERPGIVQIGLAAGILALGGIFCVLAILPGPGASYTAGWLTTPWDVRVYQSIGSIYRAWVPIPRLEMHFWNTNILDAAPMIQALIGSILLIAAAGCMARRPVALVWMLVAAGALVGFTLMRFRGATRHDGMLFIVLVAALWLASAGPKWTIPTSWGGKILERFERLLPAFLGVLLAINAVAGLMAAAAGMVYPFSATRAVANFIRANVEPTVTLAAYTDYCASPIAYWLDRPFYSISMGKDTYVNTQDDRQRFLHFSGTPDLMNPIYHLLQDRRVPVLLMLNSGVSLRVETQIVRFLPGGGLPERHLRIIPVPNADFEKGVVKDENHRLYMIHMYFPGMP